MVEPRPREVREGLVGDPPGGGDIGASADHVQHPPAGGDEPAALVDAPTHADDAAVLVVAAAEGYPTAPRTGDVIEGLDAARAVAGATGHCAGAASTTAGCSTPG